MAPADIVGFGIVLSISISVVLAYYLEGRCKHSWELLSEARTESYLEQYERVTNLTLSPINSFQLQEMCEKTLIHIYYCNKCGKLKRFVTTI